MTGQPDVEAILRHVARRLGRFADFGRNEAEVVQGLAEEAILHPRGTDLTLWSGQGPWIVLTGWACHLRANAGRPRQIFGFLLPGDVIGSFWRQPDYIFHRTIALTRLQVVSARGLMAVDGDGRPRHPTLLKAARRAEDHAQHLLLDHILRLGARDAYSGLAHLLLELHDRLERVGLAHDGVFRLPIGQRVLAQAMGFSLAHTNHTLQRMTEDGLFEAKDEILRLLEPEKMATLAGFGIEPVLATPHGVFVAGGDPRREVRAAGSSRDNGETSRSLTGSGEI